MNLVLVMLRDASGIFLLLFGTVAESNSPIVSSTEGEDAFVYFC